MKKGVESVDGVEAAIWRVPETLPEEVLGKMHAAPKREDHPVITARQLAEADGVLLGFPTRFGMMAAQMKAFLDSTGGLWQSQALAGKPAGLFFATGTQGGGAGDHGGHAAHAPRHALRARRIHLRSRDVRHGRDQGREPVRGRHFRRRRREQDAQRH